MTTNHILFALGSALPLIACGGNALSPSPSSSSGGTPMNGGTIGAPATQPTSTHGVRIATHELAFSGMPSVIISAFDRTHQEDCVWQATTGETVAHCNPVYLAPWTDSATASIWREQPSGTSLMRTLVAGEERMREGRALTSFAVDAPGLYDPKWASSCQPVYDAPDRPSAGHCAPPMAWNFGFFADSSCAAPVVFWGKGSANVPQIAPVGNGYVRVGAAHPGALYRTVDGKCVESSALNADAYLTVGGESSIEFEQVRWEYRGDERLQAPVLVTPGGDATLAIGVGNFRDVTNNSTCVPVRSPHAGVRCFPGSLIREEPTDTFVDAACTTPAYYNFGEGVSALVKNEGGMPRVLALVKFDTTRRTNHIYQLVNGVCTAGLSKPDLVPMTVLADNWEPYAKFDEYIGLDLIP
jgi:hypothetical protein